MAFIPVIIGRRRGYGRTNEKEFRNLLIVLIVMTIISMIFFALIMSIYGSE